MSNFELTIIKKIQSFSNPFFDALFQLITVLGEEAIIITILAFVYFTYDKRLGEKIAFSLFGSILINNTLKGIFVHKRPFEMYPDEVRAIRTKTATGSSFPSGHTQNAATFYTTLALRVQRKWFWILVNVLIFLIAISRLYLGVHFPKDVLVGAILGILWAWTGWYLYDRYSNTLKSKILLFIIQLLIFTPFLFFHENLGLPIKISNDFYKIYSLYLGFIPAIYLENKYVNFSINVSIKKKTIRFLLSIVVLLGCMMGLKLIFPDKLIYTCLRYFLISFLGLGLFPFVIKKFNI